MQRRTMLGALLAVLCAPLAVLAKGVPPKEVQRVAVAAAPPHKTPVLLGAYGHDGWLYAVCGPAAQCYAFYLVYQRVLWPYESQPLKRAAHMKEQYDKFERRLKEGRIMFYAGGQGHAGDLYRKAIQEAKEATGCVTLTDAPGCEGGAWARVTGEHPHRFRPKMIPFADGSGEVPVDHATYDMICSVH